MRAAGPDFSPTKFFAGRDTGHEAVVIYRSLRYLQMLGNEAAADKSVGPKGELFDLKRKTPCSLRKSFLNYKIKQLSFKSKSHEKFGRKNDASNHSHI
ncbi:MAG: hypothetical protein ACI8ZB_003359 [Desulforhopalus sp.]